MSLPTDPRSNLPLDPHADPHSDLLVASAVRAAAHAPAAGCPDAELLALYAERALSTSELTMVEPHLDGCPRCQAIVAACVRALPDASEPSTVPAGAFDPGANVGSWFAGWRWLVPIASVAAVAMVAVWIGRGPSDQVAQHASPEGLAREASSAAPSAPAEPGSPFRLPESASDEAAWAQPQERALPPRAAGKAEVAAGAETDRQASAALTGAAPRETQSTDTFAAAAPLSASDERRRARSEEAREKTTAPARAAGRLADAAAAPPATAAPVLAPAAVSPAPVAVARSGQAANAVGAATAREAVMATLTGTITYRARVPLPAGAVIEVRLLDASRADPSAPLRAGAPADTLARAEIITRGEQVPVAFSLSYDSNVIQARRRYVMQATIAVEGRIAWRTTTPHPVFVDGAAPTSPVTIVVDQMR